MVRRVHWFSKGDYPLFGFFEEHDIQVSPKVAGENLGYHPGYIGRRLRALRDAGLLVQHENGLYELSDLGRAFLAGELSDDEIESLDPNTTADT